MGNSQEKSNQQSQLTIGQLQWLLERMSSDDREVLNRKMKSCSREMFFMRSGKHFSLVVLYLLMFGSYRCAGHGVDVLCSKEIARTV